jgi:hypothetical protein
MTVTTLTEAQRLEQVKYKVRYMLGLDPYTDDGAETVRTLIKKFEITRLNCGEFHANIELAREIHEMTQYPHEPAYDITNLRERLDAAFSRIARLEGTIADLNAKLCVQQEKTND